MASTATKTLPSRKELMRILEPLEAQYAEMKARVCRQRDPLNYRGLSREDLQERVDLLTKRLSEGGYDPLVRSAISTPHVSEGSADTISHR